MKERPILFSALMVRALRAGLKTQTRRLLNPQPNNPEVFGVSPIWGQGARRGSARFEIHAAFNDGGKRVDRWLPCPYGAAADRLWVKETWRTEKKYDRRKPSRLPAGARIWFEADGPAPAWAGRLRPSIFMRKWMSRIRLAISGIRVERLQEISEADAKAEGAAHRIAPGGDLAGAFDQRVPIGFRNHFRDLWESINGAGSWGTNPWVWVVEFSLLPDAASRAA